jgi:hypothetical protein
MPIAVEHLGWPSGRFMAMTECCLALEYLESNLSEKIAVHPRPNAGRAHSLSGEYSAESQNPIHGYDQRSLE